MRSVWVWQADYEDNPYIRANRVEVYNEDDHLTSEERQWLEILRSADGNPGLTELVNKCKMYYALGK